jgi:hypothetical protein
MGQVPLSPPNVATVDKLAFTDKWNASDPYDAQRMKTLNLAFTEVQVMARLARQPVKERSKLAKEFFTDKDLGITGPVDLVLDMVSHENELFDDIFLPRHVMFDKDVADPPYRNGSKCEGNIPFYVDQPKGPDGKYMQARIVVCPYSDNFTLAAEKKCDQLGDKLSKEMLTLSCLLLHELT